MQKEIVCSIGLLLCSVFHGMAQAIVSGIGLPSLAARFDRRVETTNVTESIAGVLYFNRGEELHLVVEKPVSQRMIIIGKTMTIFYPRENRAFVMTGKRDLDIPFLPVLLLATKPDYGLTDMHYRIKGFRSSADSMVTTWSLNQPVQSQAVLTNIRSRLMKVEFMDSAGFMFATLHFTDHVKTPNGRWLPLNVRMHKERDGKSSFEHFELSGLRFNAAIPDSIAKFVLPLTADTKRYEW